MAAGGRVRGGERLPAGGAAGGTRERRLAGPVVVGAEAALLAPAAAEFFGSRAPRTTGVGAVGELLTVEAGTAHESHPMREAQSDVI